MSHRRPGAGAWGWVLLGTLALALAGASQTDAGLPPRVVHPTPPADRAAPFIPTLLPSSGSSPVDCVILAPDSLADLYEPLASYQTRVGIRTAVRALTTIRESDPRSNDLPQAIRSFLGAARDLWGTRWVILGGDTRHVPVRYAKVEFYGGDEIPSDAYYGDLDGTWDGNGNGVYGEVADSLDMNPDLAVGRLPAENRAEATLLVAKTLRYAASPIPAPLGKFLTLAEVLFPPTWTPSELIQIDGARLGESLLVRTPGCVATDRYYENFTDYPGSIAMTKPGALDAIDRGYGVVNHIGHGSRSQLSIGNDVLTLADVGAATNGDSLALWVAQNCASASIDFDCIAERMLRNAAGGAFAYVGATRDAFPGISGRISESLFDRLFQETPPTLGEAVEDARSDLLPDARVEGQARWGYFETILLGAPTIPIWRCPPSVLTVTAPASVPLSAGSVSIAVSSGGSPAESALVAVWKAGEEFRLGFTDAAGNVTLPFHPGSAGSFSLGATKPGHFPFLDSLDVTQDAPAHHAVVGPAVLDALGGDGDGWADAGETFALGGMIQNTGGSASASSLTIRYEAASSGLSIVKGEGTLAVLAPGAQASLPDSLRILALPMPHTPRAELLRVIASDGARADTAEVPISVAASSVLLAQSVFSDAGTGDGDGALEAGETATLAWRLGNDGSGRARALVIEARDPAAGIVLLDSTGVVGDVLPGESALSAAVTFQAVSVPPGRLFDLRVADAYGHEWSFPIEIVAPGVASGLRVEEPGSDHVRIGWDLVATPDLAGYRVYRALQDGPLGLLTTLPTRRIASYEDRGLTALTRYRYAVAALDSSGNEGGLSPELTVSTSPPTLAGWPASLGASTSSSVCFADLDGDDRPEVLVGAEHLYVFHGDGTDWYDGDGNPVTTGVFSTTLHRIASSPAAADLDQDGVPELIAASWDDSTVAVWRTDGTMMAGWPKKGGYPFWSTPAVGDVDGDGSPEIVVGSNGSRLYAWHADGSELRDGDGNPATDGVFFVPLGTVISSPGIADLDHDGSKEIIFGASSGRVYALHADGSPLAGAWPFTATGTMSSSPAVGDVIAGGSLEVVMCSGADSVYVITADGQRAPGWPRHLELSIQNGRVPSAALAPMRAHLGDPGLDVVACGSDGTLKVWDPAGSELPGWDSVRLGLNGADATTEASPTIADLEGNGTLEVFMGANDRRIYAYHFDGTGVDGFPIETGAEALSSPAIWDVDGDGSVDLVFAGWDRKVHAWRYPGTFLEPGMPWPLFRHDSWRTGVAGFPILSSVDGLPVPPPTPAVPPAGPMLGQNRPNPFNPVTVIPLGVPGSSAAVVRLEVFDVRGGLVATLLSRRLDPGYHEIRWDGRGADGIRVPSGIYIYRAEIGRASLTRKMAVLE